MNEWRGQLPAESRQKDLAEIPGLSPDIASLLIFKFSFIHLN